MVKIVHFNGDEKVVTKGAYESFYKPLGYKLFVENKIEETPNVKLEDEVEEELTGNKESVENKIEETPNVKLEDEVEENVKEVKNKRK